MNYKPRFHRWATMPNGRRIGIRFRIVGGGMSIYNHQRRYLGAVASSADLDAFLAGDYSRLSPCEFWRSEWSPALVAEFGLS